MRHHIKLAGFILCITLAIMSFGIIRNFHYTQSLSRGNFFFENTKKATDVQTIKLKFSDGNVITLQQKDNLWHVNEADGYYASFRKINSLIKLLYQTSIYRADYLSKDNKQKVSKDSLFIITYNKNNDVIDEAEILSKQDNNKFYYALLNNNDFLYQLNGDFGLSSLTMDWVQMPLLTLSENNIKRIQTDDFNVFRRFQSEELKTVGTHLNVPQIQNLLQNLWYLTAEEVRHAAHFEKDKFPHTKKYEITLLNGIIYTLTVSYNDDEYWVDLKLDREKIASLEAKRIIDENNMLYDGWFFKINNQTGEAIVNFVL